MTLRTPLNKVRHHGSAKSGTEHFWQQRITAVANIPLTLFLIWLVISVSGADHAQVVKTISHPIVALGLVAVIISFVWHMRLGMQVIVEDYVQDARRKVIIIILNNLFSAFIALMSVFAILKISFGA
jgi:succinate dehydrogenase / fumarate reductase membrane anchor subunit